MHVYFHALTPNHIETTVHRIHKVEITETEVNLVLNSFTTHEAPSPAWQDIYPMPLAEFVVSPYPQCVFDYLAGEIGPFRGGAVISDPAELISAREMMRIDVNRMRDATINGGCETTFGYMDTNERSRQNMNLTLATLADEDSVDWRRLDNTNVTLSKAEFAQMVVEVTAHVQRAMAYSWSLKEQINEAMSLEDLDAIDRYQWSNNLPVEPEPEPEEEPEAE